MEIMFYPFSDTDYRIYPNVYGTDCRIAYVEEDVRWEGTLMDDAVLIVDDRGLSVLVRNDECEIVAEWFRRIPSKQVAINVALGLPYSVLNSENMKDRGFIRAS